MVDPVKLIIRRIPITCSIVLCAINLYFLTIVFQAAFVNVGIKKVSIYSQSIFDFLQAEIGEHLLFYLGFGLLLLPDIVAMIQFYGKTNRPNYRSTFPAPWRACLDFIIATLLWMNTYYLFKPEIQPDIANYDFVIGVSSIIIFIISLISLFSSEAWAFLTNQKDLDEAYAFLEDLSSQAPYLEFHVSAYHMERKGIGKKARTVKVKTLETSQDYHLDSWYDNTDISAMLNFPIGSRLKLTIEPIIEPFDEVTRADYLRKWSTFQTRYENVDKYVNFKEIQGIKHYKQIHSREIANNYYLFVVHSFKDKPFVLNPYFYFFTFLSPFNCAYICWFDSLCLSRKHPLIKEFVGKNSSRHH